MFLRDRAPDVIEALWHGLVLVTTRVSCEFMAELVAFDEIVLRMRLGELGQNRITMKFEYWRHSARRRRDGGARRATSRLHATRRRTGGSSPRTLLSCAQALKEYATG